MSARLPGGLRRLGPYPMALHSGCAMGQVGAGGRRPFKRGRRAQPHHAADRQTDTVIKSLSRRPRRSLERPAVGDEAGGSAHVFAVARAAVTPAKSPAAAEGSGL